MAELARYKKAGILLADVPRIDFAGQRSAAEVSGQLAKSLDRMSQWAFGEAMVQAKEEGLQYGATNPVTQRQLLDAVTAGEDPAKLFQKKGTAFGDAARAAQVMSITSEIEMSAQQQLNMLKLGVERGETDLATAQSEIQSMLDGYGKSLVNVDPRASLKLRASLATNANSAYLAMSQSYFKQQDNLRKQAVDQWIDVTLGEQVRTIIEAGDTPDPEGGKPITVQQRIDATVRRTLLNNLNNIPDPVFARQAMKRFDDIVSKARVDGVVKIARDPAFARDPVTGEWDGVGAVQRADAGDFGAYSSLYKAMPAEEQGKVLTALRQASADRYTAAQHARTEARQRDELEVNGLVSSFPTAAGPERQRIAARLREISQSTGAVSGQTINALVKAGQGDADGNAQTMLYAEMLVRRSGVTSIDEIQRRVPGLKPKQLAKLSDMILNDGEKRLRLNINLMSGIPDNIVQMSGDQNRRKLNLTREAEAIKKAQIQRTTQDGKPGTWDPDLVIAELEKRRDQITKEKEAQASKDALSRYGQPKNTVITADTGVDELRRLKFGWPEIKEIQRHQSIIRGDL